MVNVAEIKSTAELYLNPEDALEEVLNILKKYEWQPIDHCPKTPNKGYDLFFKDHDSILYDIEWLDGEWITEYESHNDVEFSHFRETNDTIPED